MTVLRAVSYSGFYALARGLLAPGPLGYFLLVQKVPKNTPKPTVLDSLNGAAPTCRFPIRGNFLGLGANEGDSATELESVIFSLVVEQLRLTPC